MALLRSKRIKVALAAGAVALLGAGVGVYVATASGTDHTAGAVDLARAHGAPFSWHGRQIADGQEWAVETYENVDGLLCAFHTVPGEGKSGTCFDRSDMFARGPLVAFVGSRQQPGQLGAWHQAWVWGFAAPTVARLELTLTNCARIPVRVDTAGVFQHVIAAGLAEAGVLPQRLQALDAQGDVVATQSVSLGEAPGASASSAASACR